MKSYLIPFFVALITLPSCFVVDSFLEEEQETLSLPFEVIVKDSVYNYIQREKDASQKYLSYGYEPLNIIIPQALKDLEIWESRRGQTGFDQALVEQKIAELDSIKQARSLVRKIRQNHLFSLKNSTGTIVDIQKVDFILSNELEVIDLVPFYQFQLPADQEKLFAKFHYETPIIKAYSYEESQKLSKSFYQYFKKELNEKKNILERNQFLSHIMKIMEVVNATNLFDVQSVAQNILTNYMLTERADIEKYDPIAFSPLYEINEEEQVLGYYFFHTFSFVNDSISEEMSIYVKFNPFYEIERVTETNQEFDAYKD